MAQFDSLYLLKLLGHDIFDKMINIFQFDLKVSSFLHNF